MSRWGIDDHRIAAALIAVRSERDSDMLAVTSSVDDADGPDHPGHRDELFARAIWSVLVEPGDRIAGLLIAGVGVVAAAHMVLDRASPTALCRATRGEVAPNDARDGLLRWGERLRATDVLRSLDSAAGCGAHMLVPGDPQWPQGLHALGDSEPILLWARGNRALLQRPAVAIVGARAATGYGEHVAMEFAAGLSARDVVVVSGGAYGIDGMAHRAALASSGATIAVLAGGIDRLYPAGHEALLTRVAEHGLLLSEVPCGTAPTKWRFLQRNRLIAALASATVVVEAGRRSGALNTARLALGMGRPVGIVPGPVTSAASTGCHAILRAEPVALVTSTTEIMQLAFGDDGVLDLPQPLNPELSSGAAIVNGVKPATTSDPLHGRVLDALRPRRGQTPIELARAVGEAADHIRAALGMLDLDGTASKGSDGLWRRATVRSRQAVAVS